MLISCAKRDRHLCRFLCKEHQGTEMQKGVGALPLGRESWKTGSGGGEQMRQERSFSLSCLERNVYYVHIVFYYN